MTSNTAIRRITALSVVAVATVAGIVSYRHGVTVARTHGETGFTGICYPVTIDGLVLAASMSILSAARHRAATPVMAWWLLSAGIIATVGVNMVNGMGHGPIGLVLAAWPALAMTGAFELLMRMVRESAERHETNANPLFVNARTAFPEANANGNVPSLASIKRTLAVSDSKARDVRQYLAAR